VKHSLRTADPRLMSGASSPARLRLCPRASPLSRRGDSGLDSFGKVLASPIEVMVARFPVTRRLVGDKSFRAMTHRFIVSEPPRSPTLLHYGETFLCSEQSR
jgi:hypothetical protein